jgi:FtsP/CotA-like multicopper oxidase with cupredoxin domain
MSFNQTRRVFLLTAAASALLPASGLRAAITALEPKAADVQLLPAESYGTTQVWGYGGTVPGTEIRVAQGQRVQRELINSLPQPTSVHWHGIRIDNAMDGVPGLTQKAVAPGERFTYDFIAPDAGTYWYHAHQRSFEQVGRGLYGPLIVEESIQPDIDAEHTLILDDWLLDPSTLQFAGQFGAMHDRSHAGRLGNLSTTNGQFNLSLDADRHQRMRLRLINAANARVFSLGLEGFDAWVVALDGMPLAKPEPLDGTFALAPAQRMDLIVDVTADAGEVAHILQSERGESFSQVAFEVRGKASRAKRGAPAALPPNATPSLDLKKATTLPLHMEGGAMGGMRSARMNGQDMPLMEMAREGKLWAFNGSVGSQDAPPLARLSRGETVRIRMTNDTAFPHAMHLHGMHFYELASDGTPGALRDTTLLHRGEVRDIAFVADNPGKWLLHCHMLSHAASGMMSWIEVA